MPRRPAAPSSSACASCGSRTTPPTRPTRSRTGSFRSPLARARELGFETIACASTGNLANAVAAHAAAAGLESYVFIPSDLEEQKVLATGVYGTNLVGRPRQLRRRQPPVHRALRRARLGVREHQHAAVLRRGLQDARVRDRRAARVRAARPRSSARSRRGRCSPRSPAASRSGSSSAWSRATLPTFNGAQADRAARRWRRAFAAGQDFCRPVKPDTIAKSLAIGNPADGPYALDLARRSGGAIDAVTDDEIREGIKLLARDHRHLHRDRRRRHGRGAREARPARRHRPGRARCRRTSPATGLKTLDVVRGTFEALGDRAQARGLRSRPRAGRRGGLIVAV